MVNKYTIYRYVERCKRLGKEPIISLNEEKTHVLNKDGSVLGTIDEYVNAMRKTLHCDFEGIYYEHASLINIIRCKQCGAVIFTYEDERYDPNLCCPVCGKYDTSFEYWSKEDIDSDKGKQNAIKIYNKIRKWQIRDDKRYKRTGLTCSQLWKHKGKIKDGMYKVYTLERMGGCRGIRGLNIQINYWKHDESIDSYIWENKKIIPLSIYALKVCNRIKKNRKDSEDDEQI